MQNIHIKFNIYNIRFNSCILYTKLNYIYIIRILKQILFVDHFKQILDKQ